MNLFPISAPGSRRLIFLALAAAMLATRVGHVAGLPDASWAVFFLGGAYLGGATAFGLLLVEAAGLDALAILHYGVSDYCVSPAYAFLLPAYGALWFGGLQFRRHASGLGLRSLGLLAASVWASSTLCFLLSDGSFYWLSGLVAAPSLAGWAINAERWYLSFLEAPALYVAVAAALHLAIVFARRGAALGTAPGARSVS